MDNKDNDILSIFLESAISPDTISSVESSLSTLELFDYNDIYSKIYDVILEAQLTDTNSKLTSIYKELHTMLDDVLLQHGIELNDEASIDHKNYILQGINGVQYLIDYVDIENILETDETPEVIFSFIMSELTILDDSLVLSLIEKVEGTFLVKLSELISEKETEDTDDELKKIGEVFRSFCKINKGNTLGNLILKRGLPMGNLFMTYFEDMENIKINSLKDLALDILSVLYISSDGYKEPLFIFNENSEKLLGDLDVISGIDTFLIDGIKKVNDYRLIIKRN